MALQAAIGSFLTGTGASGTVVGITGLGFTPQVVLLWGGSLRTTDSAAGSEGDAEHWHGAMDANGNQFCLSNGFKDATANSVSILSTRALRTTDADDGSDDGSMVYHSMDIDGFSMRVTVQPVASRVTSFLAIAGLSNFKVGSFDAPAATGTASVTDPGFTPDTLLLIGGLPGTTGAGVNGGSLSIGIVESDGTQGAVGWSRQDGGDTAQHHLLTTSCVNIGTGTADSVDVASFAGFIGGGFSLDWSVLSGTARRISYVALQGADFEVVPYTSPTNEGTTSVAVKALPIAAIGLHQTTPTVSDPFGGFGFGTDSVHRSFFFRTNGGATVETYDKTGILVGARTPAGVYSLRFRAAIVAWDADSADIDVITNTDGIALSALLFFLSEKAGVGGPLLRYIPMFVGQV